MLEIAILTGMSGLSLIGIVIGSLMWLKAQQDMDIKKANDDRVLVWMQKREKVEA